MSFSIEKKGYSIDEVDAYIDDLEAKYVHLQSQNAELEQKLATAKRLIRRFSDTENALKQNIADSKRAAAYMISDARDRSEDLLDEARESCGEIISDLDMQIAHRMTTVDHMKAEVAAFKDELFSLYSSHIELIDRLANAAESFEYNPDYTAVADAVDRFEESAEPDCSVPEFVEYPEESIFAEIEEDEVTVDEFVIVAKDEESDSAEITFETDAVVEEDEDFDQLVLDTDAVFTDEPETEEASFEPFDDVEQEAEAEEVQVEGDGTDYFKFLADFANSDDEAQD